MSEEQSFLFDFQRSPTFLDNMNVKFHLLEMNSSNNFQVVFSTYAPTNIEDCLSSDGTLNSDVTIQASLDCSLKWENDIISIRNDVTWNIGDTYYPLKAVFIRNKSNGYVMGYSINITSFEVTNEVIFEEDTILWSFRDE